MGLPLWLIYALAAAGCAGLINVFAKVGMEKVDADLATAIRSVVQAAFVVMFAVVIGAMAKMPTLGRRPIAWSMLILSGVAGGLSWIFAFRAIQLSQVSKVAPIDKLSMPLGVLLAVILLKERPSIINWLGIALMVGGAYLTAIPRH